MRNLFGVCTKCLIFFFGPCVFCGFFRIHRRSLQLKTCFSYFSLIYFNKSTLHSCQYNKDPIRDKCTLKRIIHRISSFDILTSSIWARVTQNDPLAHLVPSVLTETLTRTFCGIRAPSLTFFFFISAKGKYSGDPAQMRRCYLHKGKAGLINACFDSIIS